MTGESSYLRTRDEVPPVCEVDGCDEVSAYLLVSGDLCERHAAEAEPESVRMCRAVLGRPAVVQE